MLARGGRSIRAGKIRSEGIRSEPPAQGLEIRALKIKKSRNPQRVGSRRETKERGAGSWGIYRKETGRQSNRRVKGVGFKLQRIVEEKLHRPRYSLRT